MNRIILFLFLLIISCKTEKSIEISNSSPYLVVLGIAQDAGYPQAGCMKSCCKDVWHHKSDYKSVVSLGIVDPLSKETWLIEATPDIKDQLYDLQQISGLENILPKGIFITHAHIGHYTGLMQLGHEVIGAKNMPVYAMPKMTTYLEKNGPWSQLVEYKNISLKALQGDSTIFLNKRISITPFIVPHRDEFSETVGYKIASANKSALFIPDIDKWQKWNRDIRQLIKTNDYALVDATFFKNGEIEGRDMSQIPHPFVEESINLFEKMNQIDKEKVYFIHFNHTNPLIQQDSEESKQVTSKGYHVAKELDILTLE